MTVEEKSKIIARLNRRRNEAASGLLNGLPPAGNMLKMRWVEELAREAQLWADQCAPPSSPEQNDECRDLYSAPVGQCVASVVGEAPGLRIESMVDIWYMQNLFYKGNVTMYIGPTSNTSFYGDFAQIMWSKSYMVGCGRSRFMNQHQGRLRTVERLVCNIAPAGPPQSESLWTPSAPASLCPSPTRPDQLYTSLCDVHKKLLDKNNVDPSMTLEEHILLNTVLDLEASESNTTGVEPGTLDQEYLTQLAVASIKKSGTTETYFKSMLKKDIVEIIGYDGKMNSNNLTYMQEFGTDNKTNLFTTIKPIKQRISFIGRPKPYNMEELTDIDYKTENYTSTADLTEENYDSEYEFVDATEENTAAQINKRNASKYSTNGTKHVVNNITGLTTEKNKHSLTTEKHKNSSILEMLMSEFRNTSFDEKEVYNLTEVDKNSTYGHSDDIDEYLQDPETVRELEEALARMEHEFSNPERQGKVRRELRKLPRGHGNNHGGQKDKNNNNNNNPNSEREYRPNNPLNIPPNILPNISPNIPPNLTPNMQNTEMEDKENNQKYQEIPPELAEEFERNRREKSDIYNMVMKYVPMFKQYGDPNGMMPKAPGNNANSLRSSFLLVLSLLL